MLRTGSYFCDAECQDRRREELKDAPLKPSEKQVLASIERSSTSRSLLSLAEEIGFYKADPMRPKRLEGRRRVEARGATLPILTRLVERGLIVHCGSERYCPAEWVKL
jgi:hypothetical protein